MTQAQAVMLAAAVATGCATNAHIPVVGHDAYVNQLVGRWEGEYDGGVGNRSGTISFILESAGDTARGVVIMVPRDHGEPLIPIDTGPGGEPPGATPAALRITFVRVADGEVGGTLAPYRDPDTDRTLHTGFRGTIDGDRITGTFTTRMAGNPRLAYGEWWVVRRGAGP